MEKWTLDDGEAKPGWAWCVASEQEGRMMRTTRREDEIGRERDWTTM